MENNNIQEELNIENPQMPEAEEEKATEESQPKKKSKNKGFLPGFIVGALVMLAAIVLIGFMIVVCYVMRGSRLVSYQVSTKIRIIENLIDKYYIDTDKLKREDLEDGIYRGIMDSLGDRYATYYSKDEYASMLESDSGSYCGIGAYLTQDAETKVISVVKPMKDSPAEKAGILIDDILVSVDGEDISDQDLNVVVSKVKGEKNTPVLLGLIRDGKEIEIEVIRDEVIVDSVAYELLDDKIGYIQIGEFVENTDDQFEAALDDLEGQGIDGLIIDLRGNPGGVVDTVAHIADYLLPEGVIVYTKDKNGKSRSFSSDDEHQFNKPLAVLVNGSSASASEILTGAIKDYHTGTIIGTTTFGKGIVQYVLPLGDGSGIKLTVEDYYTPSGNNIHGIGIDPDIEIDLDVDAYLKDKSDNQLDKAKEVVLKEINSKK